MYLVLGIMKLDRVHLKHNTEAPRGQHGNAGSKALPSINRLGVVNIAYFVKAFEPSPITSLWGN